MLDRLRIGTGIDAHAFAEEGSALWVGGVQIPHDRGLAGHSDADVLIHSVVDAILGAIGHGDIGEHFPSSDPRWKGAPSSEFLIWTRDLLKQMDVKILSIDSVVIAEQPRLKPYVKQMEEKMAECLGIESSRISVKSTTTDHLGFVGRKEGMACQANCLLLLP